jgi:hypothetical protein
VKLLSPHFTLAEMTRTSVRLLNVPGPGEVERLRLLCELVLEPLRTEFGPLQVTSGYRSRAVNKQIKGSPTSAHVHGCAADVVPMYVRDFDGDGDADSDDVSPGVRLMLRWLLDHRAIPWDQAIDEKAGGPGWLHVGMVPPSRAGREPRHMALTYREGREPRYQVYLP